MYLFYVGVKVVAFLSLGLSQEPKGRLNRSDIQRDTGVTMYIDTLITTNTHILI